MVTCQNKETNVHTVQLSSFFFLDYNFLATEFFKILHSVSSRPGFSKEPVLLLSQLMIEAVGKQNYKVFSSKIQKIKMVKFKNLIYWQPTRQIYMLEEHTGLTEEVWHMAPLRRDVL